MSKSLKRDIKDQEMLDTIIGTLLEQGRVHFMHLGVFEIVERKASKRWDYKKREMVPYPAYKTVHFRPARPLFERVNGRQAKKRAIKK